MKIKVYGLVGLPLNWAVAKAHGLDVKIPGLPKSLP